MKPEIKRIISFFKLSEQWQEEARRNLDEEAEEASYLEPEENHTPEKHILWDLTEAMRQSGTHKGFKYNAVIGISNNSAMLLNILDCGEEAEILFV